MTNRRPGPSAVNGALRQYLARYAEPEIALADELPGPWQRVLVIPAYREGADFARRLVALLQRESSVLAIVVLNRPEGDTDTAWARALREAFCAAGPWTALPGARLIALGHASAQPGDLPSHLLCIDRCLDGAPLPADEGVGLARKIGADLACALIGAGALRSPWIFTSDADADWPAGYLSAADRAPAAASACLLPFEHVTGEADADWLPTLVYEFTLHHYVAGLRWAGSPYAFHTVGSAVVLNSRHYAQVRGFPKRAGAEDFYLLNKLAKVGTVHSLDEPLLRLQARRSARVPFGTGPAVARLADSGSPWRQPTYHPLGFHYLRALLAAVEQQLGEEHAGLDAGLDAESPAALDPAVLAALRARFSPPRVLAHCRRQGKQPAQRLRHWHTWFDAFRTRQCLHYLRDHCLGSVAIDELVRQRRGAQWLPVHEPADLAQPAGWRALNRCLRRAGP